MGEESRQTNWGQYRLVIGLSFLQSMIWGLVIAMFPLFARELGAAEFAIGSLAAVHPLLSVLGAVPMGLLANRLGRRGMFYLAYSLSLAAAVAYMFTRSATALIVPQFLFGLSAVAYWPTQHSHISDNVDPTQLSRLFGLSMGLTGLGGIIGPVLAGRIADTYGFQPMYGLFAGIAVVGLLLCTKVQAPDLEEPAHRGPPLTLAATRRMLARPTLQFVYLSVIAMFVQWGMRDTFLPLYAADLNLTKTAIGALATFQTASMSGTRLLLGFMGRRAPAGRAILAFVTLSALVTLAVPALSSFRALAAVAFIAGIGSGAAVPITLSNVANATTRHERPMAMSLESASTALGRLFSTLSFGWLAGFVGIPMVFLIGNGLVLLAVFALVRMPAPGLAHAASGAVMAGGRGQGKASGGTAEVGR